MEQQIVCVIGRQHSGSTALLATLAATGRLHNFGEIFHTAAQEKPGSFFGYCARRRILFSDMAAPRALPKLCADYIAHLRELAQNRHVLIDVKFNSLGVIRPAWRYLHEEPFFLQFLKKQAALLLLIRRNDSAEQVGNSDFAQAHDEPQHGPAADGAAQSNMDAKKAAREARLIRQSEALIWSSVKNYNRRIRFKYEELFVGGTVSQAAKDAIVAEIGEPLHFSAEGSIRKNEIDKNAGIKNYEAARQAILLAAEKIASRKKS